MSSRAAGTSASHALSSGRCRVYYLDVPKTTGLKLHRAYTPCDWEHNQFAADTRLHDHLANGHPWLVNNPSEADVVVIAGHGFDRWCVAQTLLRNKLLEAHTTYTKGEMSSGALCEANAAVDVEECGVPHGAACKRAGKLFRSETAKRLLWESLHEAADALNTSVPRAIVHTNNECPPAWSNTKRGVSLDTLMLADRVRRPQDGVVPFVLSRPAWLLGDAPVPSELLPSTPWASRKLVLFAGHVPKLYINPTRYLLWRAWRRELERVSIYTKDIACALTAHHICTQPERWEAERTTFCQKDCGTTRTCKSSVQAMQRECRFYKKVPWDDELPDVPATNRALPKESYFKAAMGHRFCVIAPGDYPSTPKITEFVAVGAAGGCLPVVVVPSPVRDGARRQLPYASTWLDYCEIAFIVPESAVGNSTEMRLVLGRLNAVTEEAAEAKRAALRRVRDAFVARQAPSSQRSDARPNVADFLLHEACHLAARHRAVRLDGAKGAGKRHGGGLRLGRCLLAEERSRGGGMGGPVHPKY